MPKAPVVALPAGNVVLVSLEFYIALLIANLRFHGAHAPTYGIGSLIIGQLNDWLGATTSPLNMRYSMLLCPLACFIAALSLWQGYRAANQTV